MTTLEADPSTAPLRPVQVIAADIKLAHSIFALPFALLAACMAAKPQGASVEWGRFAGQLALIVLAMITARTAAMLANRFLDRRLDADNPRTAQRALPSGRLSPHAAVTAWCICALAFLLICAAFGVIFTNWWPALLGVPVILWISAYAYLKRFTALCHLYLGSSLAISPLAAALAVNPDALATQPALWLLSGMVLTWVAGFDVIYALQDIAIDRAQGLHSIPALLGERGALWASRGLHFISAGLLITAAVLDARFSLIFIVGLAIVLALLIYEHATVAKWGTTRIALAFFTLNGIIACLLGLLGMIDVLLLYGGQ